MATQNATQPRITPLEPPYGAEIEASLDEWMGRRGGSVPPLLIFRTMHRNPEMARALFPLGRYILGAGKLERRHRELLILRTCARCGAEYEWGVHAAVYPAKVGLNPEQVAATSTLEAGDSSKVLEGLDSLMIKAADELHDGAFVSDETWTQLSAHLNDEQLLELLLVCGWYHFISYLARSARIEFEHWQARFPSGKVG